MAATTFRLRRPRGQLVAPPGVHLMVDELAIGADGFTLTLRARLADRLAPPGARHLLVWDGFATAIDDRGHTYSASVTEHSSTGRFRASETRLVLVFAPAPDPAAGALEFRAAPATAQVLEVRPEDRWRELPQIELGELSWRVSLPARP